MDKKEKWILKSSIQMGPPEEESKSASDKNDDMREFRQKEFLCNTKFSKLYQNLIPNKHYKAIQAD